MRNLRKGHEVAEQLFDVSHSAKAIADAIEEAVKVERERCAKIAESLYDVTYWDDPVAGIAAKIRKDDEDA